MFKCARLSLPFSWNRSRVTLPKEHRTEDANPFLVPEKLGHAIGGVVDTSNMEHTYHASCYCFTGEMVSQGVMTFS